MDHSHSFLFPELETERIILRVLTLDDTDEVFAHFSDENVTRFMDIDPCKDRQEAEEIIRFHLEDSGCRWGLFHKTNQQLMGTCGYHCWVKGEEPRAEIGFDLGKEYWGQGYMREAMQTAIRFGFENMGLAMIEATVEPENERSIQLLNRLGFQREDELRDHLLYYYLKNGVK